MPWWLRGVARVLPGHSYHGRRSARREEPFVAEQQRPLLLPLPVTFSNRGERVPEPKAHGAR